MYGFLVIFTGGNQGDYMAATLTRRNMLVAAVGSLFPVAGMIRYGVSRTDPPVGRKLSFEHVVVERKCY